MDTEYRPIRKKYCEWALHYSPITDKLIKRKHILEFLGGTADEWKELADDFLADGGRCNHAYCMSQHRRLMAEVL